MTCLELVYKTRNGRRISETLNVPDGLDTNNPVMVGNYATLMAGTAQKGRRLVNWSLLTD